MNKESTNNLLKKIGKIFFIKHLQLVMSGNKVNYNEIVRETGISISSCYTRISKIKQIIRSNNVISALELCQNSKGISKTYKSEINNLIEYSKKLENNQNSKMIDIKFAPDPIIRSAKITGDLGESFVENYFNEQEKLPDLELILNKSNKSFDAVEKNNSSKKYEIKTITQFQTSNIIYLEGSQKPFDFLIICKLDNNYYIENLYKLTFEDFNKVKKSKNRDNTWFVKINNKEFLQLIDEQPQSVLI